MNQALNKLPSLDSALKSIRPVKKYGSYIFLDRDFFAKINMQDITSKKTFKNNNQCIILSPSLYWTRKKELVGISGLHKIKKIAEVVFEDLENGTNLKKIALKGDGNTYYFIAIDLPAVRKYLRQHIGIEPDDIDIVTAQDIFSGLATERIEINESYSLATIDGTMEKIPSAYLEDGHKLQLSTAVKASKIKLSPFGLKKSLSGSDRQNSEIEIKSDKWLKVSLIALSVISLAFIAEAIIDIKRSADVDKKTETLREQYKLPQTKLEIDNIISKAKNIEHSQNHLRTVAKAANSLVLQQGESIESIKLSASDSSIAIKTQRVTEIEAALKKEINITKTEKGVDSVTFKASLK